MYRDTNHRDFARALRNQPTDAEKRLWHFLRAQNLRGRKFRRQAAIGAYNVDFVCFTHKLIVELDGQQHMDPLPSSMTSGATIGSLRVASKSSASETKNWTTISRLSWMRLGERLMNWKVQRSHPSPTLPVEGREPDHHNCGVEGR